MANVLGCCKKCNIFYSEAKESKNIRDGAAGAWGKGSRWDLCPRRAVPVVATKVSGIETVGKVRFVNNPLFCWP